MQAGHAWYQGDVGHQRYLPKSHGFGYNVSFFWLDLSQLDSLDQYGPLLTHEKFGAFSYRRRDYLAGDADLQQAVLDKVASLGASISDVDQVFMLSPLANWGLYFSPLTLYYCFAQGKLQSLLAEVSNTPWNERHYYLVPVTAVATASESAVSEYTHPKNFHVSPFNPLDMLYQWHVGQPGAELQLSITNWRQQQKIFSAWLKLERQSLTASALKQLLIHTPWPCVQVVFRIYWHAVKLLVKGLPLYGHKKPEDPAL
ncbi:DUF1365 domain-containing protein [Rheinheimera riviphila]|uniref:DUF1365 domain-containing protein n=1 Tax=Rheinheimera riviphila TaxID=1834037 RepID=A0A437R341_9GAMM|nr:DUF1365 domain-containing protein [Rheinheimera riviphila]RVU41181.1 DUF1365 domain-containing protein [Rheinheimera riviphila]